MAQKPYMPEDDEGIYQMLLAFDTNIGPLIGKYGLLSADALRVKQARLCWRWFLDCLEAGRQWTESVTAKKKMMRSGPPGAAMNMPPGPVLPAVPTIDLGTGPQPIKFEPDFFIYFGSLVAKIKTSVNYEKADGDLLGIEGAEIPPPSVDTVPELKVTPGPGGKPQLEVPKGVFDGYDFQFKIGEGAVQSGTFSTKRKFVHDITLPPAGTAVVYSYCARYRYKGQAFGQHSPWVSISVRG
jgi:hypothetical protein